MIKRVKAWGNSLALRIPRYIARDLYLERDSEVRIFLKKRVLTLTPLKRKKYSLKNLTSQITPENRHPEVFTDNSIGAEVW